MEINDFSQFGARLLAYSVGGAEVKKNYSLSPAGFFPVRYAGEIGLRDVTITLEFKGTPRERALNASALVAELMRGADVLLPDGFLYYAAFSRDTAAQQKGLIYSQKSFRFFAVRHGELVTETLTETGTIMAQGNRETPARVTVSGINGTVTIFGTTITGLTGTVVLDGITGRVMQNWVNVFGNTNLTEFPKLSAGENTVTVPSGCTVTVEYYPLWW